MNKYLLKSLKYILLALLMYMPIFGFLDTLPIRIWDEARIAINAYEMFKNGDFIVTYYKHEPDMWNTKPPLLIWMQVFFMSTIGVNEIAVRLPSAIAVFFTCLSLLFLSKYYLKNFWFGFIVILVLLTTPGYLSNHIARTGDYDALLTLFSTSSCLFLFAFTETKRNKFLYLFFITLTLGALTKGVASLLFLPALALYVIFQKQLKFFFTNKHFYFGLFSFAAVVVGYYLFRDFRNPGYISIVQENELGGRFLVSQGNQTFDFWFYYDHFLTYRLNDRYLLVPCGLIIGLLSKNQRIRKLTFFVTLLIVSFFILISTAKTKLEWYDAPLYPFLAILIAVFINSLFDFLRNNENFNQSLRVNVIPYVFLFLLFVVSYKSVWTKTYRPNEYSWDYEFYEIGHYLKKATQGKFNVDGKYILYYEYEAQNLFYVNILKDQGLHIDFIYESQIRPGNVLIVAQEQGKNYIRGNFLYKELEVEGHVVTYSITSY